MKSSFLIIYPIVLMTVFGCKSSNKSEVDIIKNIERTRLKALVNADIEVAKPLHGDEFQLITPTGNEISKEAYLRQLESGILDYKIWEADSIRVKLYDNVAVLRYTDNDIRVFVNGELVNSGKLTHTNLYEKQNGKWQIIWSHASGGNGADSVK